MLIVSFSEPPVDDEMGDEGETQVATEEVPTGDMAAEEVATGEVTTEEAIEEEMDVEEGAHEQSCKVLSHCYQLLELI